MSDSDLLGPPGDQAVPSHSTLFDDPEDSPPVVSPRVSATDRGRLYRSAGATGSLAALATQALAKAPTIDPSLPDSPESVAAEAAAQQAAQAAAAEAAAQAAAKQAAAEQAAAEAATAQAAAIAAAEAARLAAVAAEPPAAPPASEAPEVSPAEVSPAETGVEAPGVAPEPDVDIAHASHVDEADEAPAQEAPAAETPVEQAAIGLAPVAPVAVPVPATPAPAVPAVAAPAAAVTPEAAAAAVIAANTVGTAEPAALQPATPLLPPPDADGPMTTTAEPLVPAMITPAGRSRQTLSWTRGTLIIMGATVLASVVDVLLRHGIGTITGLTLIVSSVAVAFFLRRDDMWAAVVAPPLSFLVALVTVGQFSVAAGSGGGIAKWFSRQALNVVTGLSLNAPWILAATLLALAVVLFRRFRERPPQSEPASV